MATFNWRTIMTANDNSNGPSCTFRTTSEWKKIIFDAETTERLFDEGQRDFLAHLAQTLELLALAPSIRVRVAEKNLPLLRAAWGVISDLDVSNMAALREAAVRMGIEDDPETLEGAESRAKRDWEEVKAVAKAVGKPLPPELSAMAKRLGLED